MNGYAVVIERADDGGYGAWSPELPGCVALGDTPEEAATEMRVAIREHVELLAVEPGQFVRGGKAKPRGYEP